MDKLAELREKLEQIRSGGGQKRLISSTKRKAYRSGKNFKTFGPGKLCGN